MLDAQVCDEPARSCKEWQEHCICTGSVEWSVKRQKAQRLKRATEAHAQAPQDANEVARRFDQATGANAAALTQEEEVARENQDQAAEDEENEELFADYEPRSIPPPKLG